LGTWHDFLAAAALSHTTYESGQVSFGGFVTPLGAMLSLGGTVSAAYAVQVAATLVAGLLVAHVWTSSPRWRSGRQRSLPRLSSPFRWLSSTI
jgi:hypothetical protein